MKLITRMLSLLVLAAITTLYTGCDKGDGNEKSEEQKQLESLSSTWALSSANDGTDRTADFQNLVLTISGTFAKGGTYNYSLTGTRPNPSPWPENGTWKFGADVTKDIIRDPGTDSEINLQYVLTDTSLTITFNIPSGSEGWPGSGRVRSVTGDWTFEFTKQ